MRIAIVLFAAALGGCIVAEPAPQPTTPAVVSTDHRTDPAPAEGGGYAEAGPLECHGNESVVLSDCVIEGDVAIDAHGNCSVSLTNCSIRGSSVAINAHGNASVVIVGGSVEGPVAVDAHGNATVQIETAAIAGDIDRHGNATVNVY